MEFVNININNWKQCVNLTDKEAILLKNGDLIIPKIGLRATI